jgi:hypothetical protein
MNMENSSVYENEYGEPIPLYFEELLKRTFENN